MLHIYNCWVCSSSLYVCGDSVDTTFCRRRTTIGGWEKGKTRWLAAVLMGAGQNDHEPENHFGVFLSSFSVILQTMGIFVVISGIRLFLPAHRFWAALTADLWKADFCQINVTLNVSVGHVTLRWWGHADVLQLDRKRDAGPEPTAEPP